MLGPAATVVEDEARALQDVLGEIHDCDVLAPRLKRELVQLTATTRSTSQPSPRAIPTSSRRTARRALQAPSGTACRRSRSGSRPAHRPLRALPRALGGARWQATALTDLTAGGQPPTSAAHSASSIVAPSTSPVTPPMRRGRCARRTGRRARPRPAPSTPRRRAHARAATRPSRSRRTGARRGGPRARAQRGSLSRAYGSATLSPADRRARRPGMASSQRWWPRTSTPATSADLEHDRRTSAIAPYEPICESRMIARRCRGRRRPARRRCRPGRRGGSPRSRAPRGRRSGRRGPGVQPAFDRPRPRAPAARRGRRRRAAARRASERRRHVDANARCNRQARQQRDGRREGACLPADGRRRH